MSDEYTMAATVGAPGQTSVVVIVTRGQELGPIDPRTFAPLVTWTLVVAHCERLPAGLKDSEIAERLNILLGSYPYTSHTRVFIEHTGGKTPISRMRDKIRPELAIWAQGVRVVTDSEGITRTADGLRRVTQSELVNYMVPICADAELRNPFPELSQQLLAADPNAVWREGDSDLAGALFLAAWFSRTYGGPRSTLLI
jgi:hypothetical protein